MFYVSGCNGCGARVQISLPKEKRLTFLLREDTDKFMRTLCTCKRSAPT